MATFGSIIEGIKGFKVLKPHNEVDDIIHCIEKYLPLFVSSSEFIDITSVKKNENQHSTAFCVYMNYNSPKRICFSREGSQKGSSTIDMVVYAGSKVVFAIEAKLLPTPLGTTSDPRDEHEYVYGKGAGIQRFKDGKHGLDDQNVPLQQNALIAYIKEDDFKCWYERVNQWINDASWPSSESLDKIYFKTTAKLLSEHTRLDKSLVKIHHFWVIV